MDIASVGPMEQLTAIVTQLLAPTFVGFPAHDAAGAVLGVPVLSFYADVPVPWPAVVVRMHGGVVPRSAIGNLAEVNNGAEVSASGLLPGQTAETLLAENATLELRMGARSEVERERLIDWAFRALHFNIPQTPGSLSLLQLLGSAGIVVTSIGAPVLADVDPAAPRPQSAPPWPGQLFVTCRAEVSVVLDSGLGTITVVPPTLVTSPADGTVQADGV